MTNEEFLRAIFGLGVTCVQVAIEESGEKRFRAPLPDGRTVYPLPKRKSIDGAIVPDLYISPFPGAE
jgi:hypothetical protein